MLEKKEMELYLLPPRIWAGFGLSFGQQKMMKMSLPNSHPSSHYCCSVTKLCLNLCDHGLQHARAPCSSLPPRACSNSCPLSRRCHPNHLILRYRLLLLPSIFPSVRVFFNELAVHIRWPKYWSCRFSISPSKVFRVDLPQG